LQEIFGINDTMKATADRFAEEGYVVLVPDLFWRIKPGIELGYDEADMKQALAYLNQFDTNLAVDDIAATIAALRAMPEQAGKVGAVGYCLGGKLAFLSAARTDVDCAVSYYGVGLDAYLDEVPAVRCPMVFHFPENDALCPPETRERISAALRARPQIEQYVYPGCDHAFAAPARPQYDKPAAMMAYSRTLALLRKVLGPVYDLNALWEAHCYHEFATRDVEAVMPTMVAQPYVNHVPTMTGGVGHDNLKRFYTHHFVNSNPADTKLIPISRTSAQIASSTNSFSAARMTVKSTGCYRALRQRENISRCRCSRSCASAATSFITSTSIGIRLACSCRWACSIRKDCPWPALKARANCWTKRYPRTN